MSVGERMRVTERACVLIALVCTAGCASAWKIPDIQAVGPAPGSPAATAPGGYLRVYSASTENEFRGNAYYYPHRSYFIYDAQGKTLVLRVQNNVGTNDETPALVSLPAGRYKVLADDEGYGRIMFPVVIRPRQTTLLHLDGAWEPPAHASASQVVRLPNGEYIGWSALATQ
jgi:hypothetical protein